MRHIPVALALIFFFWVEFDGRDFGKHWDEMDMFRAVESSINSGTLLPKMYNYPSVSYYLVMSRMLPDMYFSIRDVFSTEIEYTTPTKKSILTPSTDQLSIMDFLIQTRVIFISVTLLSIVWTYLLVLYWKKSLPEALLAALLLGSSWEFSYHARWIAPDGILMQFVILTMLFITLSLEHKKQYRKWLKLAAIFAGVSCGTKYFGGVMLIPVLLANLYQGKTSEKPVREKLFEYFTLIGLFATAFLITTPGAILQPIYFIFEVLKQMSIYKTGWYGHTVEGGLEHFRLNLEYFALVAFSKHWPIALFFSSMAILGMIALGKKNLFKTCIFLSGPLVWLFYESGQNVMGVRNLLLFLPFIAILSAAGITFCVGRVKNPIIKTAISASVSLLLIINAMWLVNASESIQKRRLVDAAQDTQEYLTENKTTMFFLSKGVREILSNRSIKGLTNISITPEGAEEFVFQSREPFLLNLISNKKGRYHVVSGAYDVNYDYYPLWEEPKIISTSISEARSMSIIE